MTAEKWAAVAKTFRQTYAFPVKARHTWFPGHMQRGLNQMQRALSKTDCIVEVHDARMPLTGRNRHFKSVLCDGLVKPHVLVFNKKDLASSKDREKVIDRVKAEEPNIAEIIYTNCNNIKCAGLQKILPTCVDLIKGSNRYNRELNPDSNILIIGIPNVGKSSLINLIRNRTLQVDGRATSVGATPGVTRAVLTRIRLCDDPLVYVIDTPGIMAARIRNMHMGMKLAACACLKDDMVGEENIADYLLYMLNQQRNFKYVECLGVNEPCDNIRKVLAQHCLRHRLTVERSNIATGQHEEKPNYHLAAQRFVRAFRSGRLGQINLDADVLLEEPQVKTVIRLNKM